MNEDAIKAEIAALSDRMVALGQGQRIDVYVSALVHTIRSCGDAVPASRVEIGRMLLRVGGMLVSGDQAPSQNPMPAVTSTSIH